MRCEDGRVASSQTRLLLARPGFTRYFLTVAAARSTGVMFNVAGVLLVLERTHDLALAGIVVAAATLPAAFTGPFLGGWLDIVSSRRRLLVLDRLVTAAALAAILVLTGHAPNWLIPVLTLLFGATSPLSSGGFQAVLPEIAGDELLETANAFEGASINAAFIVGPALAGLIAAAAGASAAIEVQIGAGLLLAVVIAFDATFELRPQHDEAPMDGVLHAVREGLAATWRIRPLRWNMTIDALYVLAWSTLNVSLPAFAIAIGAGAHASGYMWASVAAGSMVGGFALRPRERSEPRFFIGGYLLAMAATAAVWPLAHNLVLVLVLIFVTGVLDGPGLVALISIRQRLAPPHLRAQIFTTASSFHSAVLAAGAAGAGLFHNAFGTDATVLLFAALLGGAGLLAMASQYEAPRSGEAQAGARPPLAGE